MQIPQSNVKNMLKAISDGNHVFNEQITVCTSTKTPCPTCTYDPVRKESTDIFCQTCNGKGMIVTVNSVSIPASVETEEDFKYDFTRAGRFVKGQIYVTIDNLELTTVLNASNKYNLDDYNQLRLFCESFDYFIWKGAKYSIHEFEPGFLQGNLYEIGFVMDLIE